MNTLAAILLALEFIRIMQPDGTAVDVNPNEIITLRPPREDERRGIHKAVRCVLFTADGKFLGAIEDCNEVRRMIRELGGKEPPHQ